MSLGERFALSMIGENLRKAKYSVGDVWADCLEVPTDGGDDIVDSAWYAGQVIQKMADMCAGDSLINDNDVIIFDSAVDIMPVAMHYLFQHRRVHLVEFRDGDLYYQNHTYQPIDLMEYLNNA